MVSQVRLGEWMCGTACVVTNNTCTKVGRAVANGRGKRSRSGLTSMSPASSSSGEQAVNAEGKV